MFSYIFFIILLALAIACCALISIADFRHRIIPDKYLFPLMLIGLILTSFYSFPISIHSAVIGASFGYILGLITGTIFERALSRKANQPHAPIGLGDIKLLGVGGLWLGLNGLGLALIIACLTGAVWAHRKHQRYIPFAPFFFIGGFLSFITNLFLL